MTQDIISTSTPSAPRFARGWYIIQSSDALAVGEVQALRYFAQDFVLYRDDNGQAQLLDAFCPHLGAHLGFGGKVVGKNIRCPFHAWEFDGQGVCQKIPYAKNMPKKALTRGYTLKECNGVIFFWYHPDGAAADFEIPLLPEYGDPQWQPWVLEKISIDTQPREVLENVADSAHFQFVHGMDEIINFENIYDGHKATQIMTGRGGLGVITSSATYYGPGYQVTEMDAVFETRLLNANIPVDDKTLHLWFGVMMKKTKVEESMRQLLSQAYEMEFPEILDEAAAKLVIDMYIARTRQGYYEDVQIWEHKVYREQAALCDGDGPINKLRKWYQQFYTPTNTL